ncbi:MAG: hypothetical protein ABI281_08400 [Caldimonas sp.]
MNDPTSRRKAEDVKPLPASDDDEEETWRHAPVAPKDKGVIESLGESVSDVVTGSEAPPGKVPKT